ncbi:hypothetical protein SESBI_26649 [Sesbania bispinosa]|nr:hypothetical protein SESBI_26649 [Sesbania bispinosa]
MQKTERRRSHDEGGGAQGRTWLRETRWVAHQQQLIAANRVVGHQAEARRHNDGASPANATVGQVVRGCGASSRNQAVSPANPYPDPAPPRRTTTPFSRPRLISPPPSPKRPHTTVPTRPSEVSYSGAPHTYAHHHDRVYAAVINSSLGPSVPPTVPIA